VKQDRQRAFELFLRAAKQGHAGAQYNLGSMYVNGDGVPRDVAEGLKWLYLSRDKLHSSRYLIFTLEDSVSAETLAEGKRRAEAWRNGEETAHPEPL
jgi:TPR repeat protein